MLPAIATLLVACFILVIFRLDRSKGPVDRAIWIPIIWLSISASRMISQWMGGVSNVSSSDAFVEGNPLDAAVFGLLLAAGVAVLLTRRQRVKRFLRANWPLLLFLGYCAVSSLWSDYSFVAFKRWIKAAGDVTMVLVVLTEPEPEVALRKFPARAGFFLIPLSILLIRYYPSMGRAYSYWTGEAYNIGVATGKNGLGYVCLVFGVASLWCFLQAYRRRDRSREAGTLVAHGAILILVLWLFRMAHSATSFACFLIGGGIMAVASMRTVVRSPAIHVFVASMLFVVVYATVLDPSVGLVESMGRDATLTGRTDMWHQLLQMDTSPVFGVGYESFWLGPRLQGIWKTNEQVNQAHNGYLEVFLDLGWTGVILLGLVMVWGYRGVISSLRKNSGTGALRLAFFVIAVIYNLTEHAFRELHPVWIVFLLAVTVIPEPRIGRTIEAVR